MKPMLALALPLIFALSLAGCGGGTKETPSGETCDSADYSSDDCACGKKTGQTSCVDSHVVCECDNAGSNNDDTPPAVDAGGGGKKPDDASTTTKKDTGTPASDASQPSQPSQPKADSSTPPVKDPGGDGGSNDPVPSTGGLDPILPDVTGDCPDFKTGSATIGGVAGISLTVGPKAEGTGSLIFYWHGTGSGATEFSSTMPAPVRKEINDQGGIIVAFGGSSGTGGDCSGTGTFGRDDFKIADLIASCAVKNHGINPKRIYTTGCSAGGLMAGCMSIQRSNYIAAAVPNSGGITTGYGAFADPKRVPAVMTMHGGPSDMVIVTFSETSEAYDNFMMAAGSYAMDCNHMGGHCQAPAALQTSAWQFMKDHPYGVKPEPYTGAVPTTFPPYCKTWVPTTRKPVGGPT